MKPRVLAPLALVLVVAACSADTGGTTRPSVSGPTPAAPSTGSGSAEPGVIKGRAVDQQGDPVAGAQIRLTGYTGAFTGTDENLVTDASGAYRIEVPNGSYEVFATATVEFEGEPYVMNLRPADGDCEPRESAAGIVKDMVLTLSGLQMCFDYVDPDIEDSYYGGPVSLLYGRPRSLPADATLSFSLEPVGMLADGSAGERLQYERTALAMETTFGPLEDQGILHDIPLGRYRISGTATLPDGSSQPLRFAVESGAAPSESAEFGFDPYLMLPYGIRTTNITVVDADWVPGG